MTDEFKFHIGDTAVEKILELKDQEPGDKDYALFLQIDLLNLSVEFVIIHKNIHFQLDRRLPITWLK